MQGVESQPPRPLDAVELKRTDRAWLYPRVPIHAYVVFSVAGHAKFRPLARHGTL